MTTFRVESLLKKNKNTAHKKQNQRKPKEKNKRKKSETIFNNFSSV